MDNQQCNAGGLTVEAGNGHMDVSHEPKSGWDQHDVSKHEDGSFDAAGELDDKTCRK